MITEALSNTARHANAARVEVHLTVTDTIIVRIEDDRIGLPLADARRGSGLNNMTTRAARLDGDFTMRPGLENGTIVELSVPLDRH